MTLRFHAVGTPVSQGSKRHVGGGRMIEAANVRPWRDTITYEAKMAYWQGVERPPITGPVQVELLFTFTRNKSHYRTGRYKDELKPSAPFWHVVKPDLDKLTRAVCDALTTARVINDDSQVARIDARKTYGDHPGVTVTVYELAGDHGLGFEQVVDELYAERYA